MAIPTLPNVNALVAMGINPATGLPRRFEDKSNIKCDIRKALRVLDEQDAINRYKWHNLPSTIDSELLERVIYYRGQAMFFYMDAAKQWFFLPYALDGTIDVYGRYTGVTPLPFNGTSNNANGKEIPWITGLIRKPLYDVPQEVTNDTFNNSCVLLHDYAKQISQRVIPRQELQDPVLSIMAEVFPMARTNLLANCGIKGMRVTEENQQASVKEASKSIQSAAMNGDPYIPIVAMTEIQDFANPTAMKSEEFLLYMQSLDNFRLSLLGLDNGGLFLKKSHVLQNEQDMNSATASRVYNDGLRIRQRFCDIVNSVWKLGIWCESTKEEPTEAESDDEYENDKDGGENYGV